MAGLQALAARVVLLLGPFEGVQVVIGVGILLGDVLFLHELDDVIEGGVDIWLAGW